ncbi:MAG: hypothetical protein ABFC84_16030 [Veillonellales bacterium]
MSFDLQTIVERIMPPMHFALITPQNAAVVETANDLWAALVNRRRFECLLFASPDVSFLHQLVGQKYPPLYFQNITADGAVARLAIPIDCTMYFAMEDDCQVVNPLENPSAMGVTHACVTPTTCNNGCWAVSGLNGFCVAEGMAEVISILSSYRLKEPTAIWCEDLLMGRFKARESYVNRFYQRYDFRHEIISWIPMDLDCYIDEAFDQREHRRQKNQTRLFDLYEKGF